MALDNDIANCMAVMMHLPFMHGFPNNIWAKCLDVMLKKKSGDGQIHQLRIIGLVEADFNTALKIFFAKQIISNSERTSLTEEK